MTANTSSSQNIPPQAVLLDMLLSSAKLIDLQLMVVLSGQERSEAEYRTLFEAAELHLVKIWPTHSLYSILEGIPF